VNVEGKKAIDLVVFHNHIFPDVQIPCSMFFVRNMAKIAKEVKNGQLLKKDVFRLKAFCSRKPHRYDMADKDLTMSMAKAVKLLFLCGHFEAAVPVTKLIQLEPEQDVKLEEAFAETCQRAWEYRPVDSREQGKMWRTTTILATAIIAITTCLRRLTCRIFFSRQTLRRLQGKTGTQPA
jgi:hypothetical protein